MARSIRGRLRRLEAVHAKQAGSLARSPEGPSGLAAEIREIDRHIAELEAGIAEAEASMTPEEVERARAEHKGSMAYLEGLSLDEKIAALEAEIEEEENATQGRSG